MIYHVWYDDIFDVYYDEDNLEDVIEQVEWCLQERGGCAVIYDKNDNELLEIED